MTGWQDEEITPTEPDPQPLTPDELAAQDGTELPDREEVSLINANLAIPINAAIAANVLADDSVALADAEQAPDLTQGT